MKPFTASFWELASVYALASSAILYNVCIWGCVQHSIVITIVGGVIAVYWGFRSLECLAAGIECKWKSWRGKE